MNSMKLLKTFIIGSSYPVMLLPLLYMGIPHMIAKIKTGKNPLGSGGHYELFPVFLPIYYGTFVVLAQTVGKSFIKNDVLRLALAGGTAGVILSFLGRFGADFPKRVFKYIYDYPTHLEYLIHPLAFTVYALEFGIVVYALLWLFNLL